MKAIAVVRRLHRWAGLVTGAVITVASVTGAMLVYMPELERALNAHLWQVPEGSGTPLQISALVDIVRERYPERRVNTLDFEGDPHRSVVVSPGRDLHVFVHPRSGEILGARVPSKTLSGRIEGLHRNLLAGEVGHAVVALSTVVLLVVIVLGLWLWWPQTRAQLKPSLWIHLGRGWKRANYDLHNVLGFYCALVLILLSATGVLLAYPGLRTSIGRLLFPSATVAADSITPALPENSRPAGLSTTSGEPVVNLAIEHAGREFPGAFRTTVRFPPPRGGPLTVVKAMARPSESPVTHTLTYDAGTGALLGIAHSNATAAQKADRLIGRIHLGNVYGWPTKAIAFLVSLVAGTLPITGAIVWFPRWRRKRRRKRTRARPGA